MFLEKSKKSFLMSFVVLIILGIGFLLADVSMAQEFQKITINENLPVPTLEIKNINQSGQLSGYLTISGTALNFGKVDVYIDGSFKGNIPVTNSHSGYGDWEYIFDQELISGEHEVAVNLSYFQKNKSFSVEKNFEYVRDLIPAPTLFDPVVKRDTTIRRPWVRGVMFTGYDVEVFVDGELDGQTKVTEHESGVGSFEYQPSFDLEDGYHFVRVRAVRLSDGKKSSLTDILIFKIGSLEKAAFLKNEKAEFLPPVPAPTILLPTSGTVFVKGKDQIKIQGVVHENHKIKIYFDGLFAGSFMPEAEKPTEVVPFDFALSQNEDIKKGVHTVHLQAINPQGEISGFSDQLSIFITGGDEKKFLISPSQIGGGVSSQVLGEKDEKDILEENLEATEVVASGHEEDVVAGDQSEESTENVSEKVIKFGVFFLVLILVGFFIGYIFRKDEDEK
jgi:hypothetical protein